MARRTSMSGVHRRSPSGLCLPVLVSVAGSLALAGTLAGFAILAPANTVVTADSNRVEHALIEHWNGRAWTRQASPDPGRTFDALYGVRAVSPASAWAVGAYDTPKATRSLVLRWNGTSWKQVASPSPAIDSQFDGVAATTATSAWAVGLPDGSAENPLRPGRAAPAARVSGIGRRGHARRGEPAAARQGASLFASTGVRPGRYDGGIRKGRMQPGARADASVWA